MIKKLRQEVYESNATTKDQILEVVEDTIAEVLKKLDHGASMNCEKYDGVSELAHYFAGQGMNCRDIAEDLGIDMTFDPLTNEDYYEGINE